MAEDQLIGIYVRNICFLEPYYLLSHISVDGYLVDKKNGTSTKANSSKSNLDLFKSPFTLIQNNSNKSDFQSWNSLLVIEENFIELKSEDKILLFEIFIEENVKNSKDSNKNRIAWAFLVPLATDGSTNTNQELKVQLYKIKKDCKLSHQDCSIFHLYSDHKHKKLFGSIQLSVKEVIRIKSRLTSHNENISKEIHRIEEKVNVENTACLKSPVKSQKWSRIPGQSCKIPNSIQATLSQGKNGVSFIKFSRNGFKVAASSLSKIYVYNVLEFTEAVVLNSHLGFIYELDWSFDDKYLLSVSSDCRGVIWSIDHKTPIFVLPHPSYVYCGKWFGGNDEIVTGGKDHLIRLWRKSENGFDLIEEICGHSGFVSCLTEHNGSMLISGDSLGCIIIRKRCHNEWNLIKKLNFSEISQHVVDSIHIHSSQRRIVITVRSRCSYLVDIVGGVILQEYKSSTTTFSRSVSCLTPCGSFLLSFCQNGDLGVWEVNTGKLFASYNNLFPVDRLSELSGCIHYHPHEHMVGIVALGPNYPILVLKYEFLIKCDLSTFTLSIYNSKTDISINKNHILPIPPKNNIIV